MLEYDEARGVPDTENRRRKVSNHTDRPQPGIGAKFEDLNGKSERAGS